MSKRKLIQQMKAAHAIEVGASLAYYGHYRSLPQDSSERLNVFLIMKDEIKHRKTLYCQLAEMGECTNPVLDGAFWLIGSSISLACHLMGRDLAMWGARIMEKLGTVCYLELSRTARDLGETALEGMLVDMFAAEKRHEEYFKSVLEEGIV